MSNSKIKLICIPFSGGNAYSYSGFKNHLAENIELINLELPGRGKRIAEPLLYTIEAMTNDLYTQVANKISEPYVIFGHSLGALLGIYLTRLIASKELNLPKLLILSGQTAPSVLKPDDRYKMTDDEFINMLREMDGTPEELLTDKNFIQFFLPVVRADFQSISSYNYTQKNMQLDIPITILLGNDENISDAEARLWQLETDSTISVKRFDGGHFFVFDKMDKVCELISEETITACQ